MDELDANATKVKSMFKRFATAFQDAWVKMMETSELEEGITKIDLEIKRYQSMKADFQAELDRRAKEAVAKESEPMEAAVAAQSQG